MMRNRPGKDGGILVCGDDVDGTQAAVRLLPSCPA